MLYAIILAGGTGSRFWPLSSVFTPKQFLKVGSDRTMLEETLFRIRGFFPAENIYIASNRKFSKKIKAYLKDFGIPQGNLLAEPQARNTFAPIAVLSSLLGKIDPNALVAVLPCDHLIKDKEEFRKLLNNSFRAASSGSIVTLGIKPGYPHTGYGYIRTRHQDTKTPRHQVYRVEKFVEKPSLSKAKRFIKDGRYYWNAGIFIFKPSALEKEIRRFLPQAGRIINRILNLRVSGKLWQQLPSISIDYAVMEKTKKLVLLAVEKGWVDLGSWQAIGEIMAKDKSGNILRGNVFNIGSKNTIVWAGKRKVAVVGLKDIIVVDSKDGLLVCSKDSAQDVRKVSFEKISHH